MKKMFWVFAYLVVFVFIAGCGSSTNSDSSSTSTAQPASGSASVVTQELPKALKLMESGYAIDQSSYGGPYVHYAFILQNPNASIGAEFPTVRITMRDASGQVIGTSEQTMMRIFPNETIAWGGQADANGKQPATVEFAPYVSDRNWQNANAANFKAFQIAGLIVSDSGYITKWTGELVNPNSQSFEQVAVSVLLRDANGKLVVGYSGFASHVPSNGSVPFEVSALGEVPQYSKFEAYATPWV